MGMDKSRTHGRRCAEASGVFFPEEKVSPWGKRCVLGGETCFFGLGASKVGGNVSADKTSVVSADKTSAVSADKTSVVSLCQQTSPKTSPLD